MSGSSCACVVGCACQCFLVPWHSAACSTVTIPVCVHSYLTCVPRMRSIIPYAPGCRVSAYLCPRTCFTACALLECLGPPLCPAGSLQSGRAPVRLGSSSTYVVSTSGTRCMTCSGGTYGARCRRLGHVECQVRFLCRNHPTRQHTADQQARAPELLTPLALIAGTPHPAAVPKCSKLGQGQGSVYLLWFRPYHDNADHHQFPIEPFRPVHMHDAVQLQRYVLVYGEQPDEAALGPARFVKCGDEEKRWVLARPVALYHIKGLRTPPGSSSSGHAVEAQAAAADVSLVAAVSETAGGHRGVTAEPTAGNRELFLSLLQMSSNTSA